MIGPRPEARRGIGARQPIGAAALDADRVQAIEISRDAFHPDAIFASSARPGVIDGRL